ncbi:hypothetical protein ABZX75_17720 [Streptomyces sp. NPDC003038]|uniref:hypothetical protein n=1 Tax=unclassified Streptomyces TaxID=2593676 RepID=UPI0033BEBF74
MPTPETGHPGMDTVLVWGGALTLLVGASTAVWRVVRGGLRLGRRIDLFIDDWYGEAERPGVPARPGVMARMSGIEQRLTRVEHELYPNSGGSLRDAVDLANERLARLCPDESGEGCGPPDPPTASP